MTRRRQCSGSGWFEGRALGGGGVRKLGSAFEARHSPGRSEFSHPSRCERVKKCPCRRTAPQPPNVGPLRRRSTRGPRSRRALSSPRPREPARSTAVERFYFPPTPAPRGVPGGSAVPADRADSAQPCGFLSRRSVRGRAETAPRALDGSRIAPSAIDTKRQARLTRSSDCRKGRICEFRGELLRRMIESLASRASASAFLPRSFAPYDDYGSGRTPS